MAAGASLVLLLAVMATTAPQADAVAKNFVNASMPTLRPTFVVNFDMATVICQGSADPTDLHLHDINILCDGKKDCYDSPAMHDEIFPYCEGTCSPECSKHGACLNDGEKTLCFCNAGFHGQACELLDNNECSDKPCHWLAHCWNTYGSYKCNCFPGFNGDGYHCLDNDECQMAAASCPEHSECINLPGTYLCNCTEGFAPKGLPLKKCEDIDECKEGIDGCEMRKTENGDPFKCQNSVGSFQCVQNCDPGFIEQNGTCVDIDDCALSPCHHRASCKNLPPPLTFACSCEDGLEGDGINVCKANGSIDCVSDASICDRHANCDRAMKTCSCESGYAGDGTTCDDVDECRETSVCKDGERCLNLEGWYLCCDQNSTDEKCREDHGVTDCVNGCGANAECTLGECTCKLGYEGFPLIKCEDVDECMNEGICSNMKEWCVNTDGGFHCCFDGSPQQDCKGLAIESGPDGKVGLYTFGPPIGESTGLPLNVEVTTAVPANTNATETSNETNVNLPVEREVIAVTSTPILFTIKPVTNSTEMEGDENEILPEENDTDELIKVLEEVAGPESANLTNSQMVPSDLNTAQNLTLSENDIERNTSTMSIPEKAMNESEASTSPVSDQSFIPAIQSLDVHNDSSAKTNESTTVALVDSVIVTTHFDNETEARIDVGGTQSPTEDPVPLILNGGPTDEMTTSAAIVKDGAKSKTTATPVDGEFGIEIGQGNTNDSSNANTSAKVGDGKSTSPKPNNATSSEGVSTTKNTSEVNPDADTMSINKGTEASNVTSETKPHDDKLPIDKGTSVSNDTSQEQPDGDKQPTDGGSGGASDLSETKLDGDKEPIDKETGNTSESSATKADGDKQPIDKGTGSTSDSSETKPDGDKLPIDTGTGGTTNTSEMKTDGGKLPIDKATGNTTDSSETKPDGGKLPIEKGTGVTTNTSETNPDDDKLPIDKGTGGTTNTSETKPDDDKLPIDKGTGGTTNTSETKPDDDKLLIDKGTGGAEDASETKPGDGKLITSEPIDEGAAAANETSEERKDGDPEFGLEISSVANDTSGTKTNESNAIKSETGTNNLKQTTVSSTDTNETDDGDQEFGLEISSVTNDTSDTKTNKDNATKPEAGIGNLKQTTVLPNALSPPVEIDGEFGLEISSVANNTSSSTTNMSNSGTLGTDAINLKQTTISPDVSNMTTGIDGEFGLEISAGKGTSGNGTDTQSSSKPSTEKLPVESVTETVAVGGETVEPRTTSGVPDEKQPPTTIATDQRTSIGDGCRSDNDCSADSFCERRTGVCRCQPGFNRINSEGPCIDIDECARGSAKCDSSSTCVNFVGGYDCRCDGAGYRKKGRLCVDIDECVEKSDHCDTTAKCVNTDGGYSCQCPSKHTAVGKYGCLPANEKLCSNEEMKTHQCTEHSICVVLSGSSVKCTDRCKNGYIMNSDGKCEDVNECDSSKKCSINAECTNTEGSFECNCLSGYVGNGFVCEDQDECSLEAGSPCHPQATCINTIGSFTCGIVTSSNRSTFRCPKGWSGDGVSNCYNPSDPRCRDVATACDGVSEGVSCITTGDKDQDAVCQCSNGYRWNPVVKKCQDINECAENRYNCDGPSTQCVNEEGSYSCRCRKGYSGSGNRCEDIDECGLGTSGCDVSATCVNTQGSFKCSCKAGFTGDGKSCKEVIQRKPCSDASIVNCRASNKDCHLRNDGGESCEGCLDGFEPKGNICQPRTSARMCAEPAANDCDANADCIDVAPGKHFCACRAGYIGDGQHCDDADECNLAPDICGTRATCVNTLGGYRCFCDIGYIKRLRGDGVIQCEAFSTLCPGAGTPNENSKPCAPGQLDCPKGFFCEKALCCPKPEPNNCFFNRKLCHTNAKCVDGHCRCNTGYDGDGIAKCTDRSICAGKCHTRAVCLEDGNCHCWGNGDALTTCDIDPLDCVIDPDICHAELGYCNRQRRRCFCKDGSYGNGKYCTKNENDCSARPEICSNDAVCIEHRCGCRDGYSGNGRECVSITDVTPCDDCDSNAECISDKCVCKSGFKGDGKTCVYEKAIAPCADCHFNAVCLSDVCVCKSGYLGDGKSCVPDREDCQIYPGLCHSNAECRSDIRRCTCKEGFTGDGERCDTISRTCETQPDLCHENAYCGNGTCICKRNFSGDGIVDCVAMNDTLSVIGSTESVTTRTQGPPILLNRCETVRVSCHKNADCRNINTNAEGYECVCKAGFHGDGQSCQDINECETFANCHPNARCENTMGSYACVCKPGFRGDGSRACVKADDPLDVSVSCEPDGIVLKVLKTDGFSGRMYVKGQSDNKFCSRQFDGTKDASEHSFKVLFQHCDMTKDGSDTFLTTVIVQKHKLFVTSSADAYDLRCTYPAGMKMVMAHFNVSMLTTVESMLRQGPEGRCSLSVVDSDTDQPLQEATVGDPIRLKVAVTPRDIFAVGARNCYAVNMEDGKRYRLTDEFGCAIDPEIFPDWTRSVNDPTKRSEIHADFRTFKWPESSRVRFQCDCSACIESCRWVDCRSRRHNEFRRRHRYRYYRRRFFARAKRSDTSYDGEDIDMAEDESEVMQDQIYSTVIVVKDGSEEEQAEKALDSWLLEDNGDTASASSATAGGITAASSDQQCVSTSVVALAVSGAVCCLVALATGAFLFFANGKST